MNHTKVIATIGPASSSKEVIRELFTAGVNVCRLNFSHGKHEEHLRVINNIIELNQEMHTNVTILADLQGPKIRIGEVEGGMIELKNEQTIELVTDECLCTSERLYINYLDFAKYAKSGNVVLIDDGKIKLEVVKTNKKNKVTAKVIYGGQVTSKKGVNLPNTKVSIPSLTEKDIVDATFALQYNVDWIALSFVRSPDDLIALRDLCRSKKKFARIIAKIEKPEALENIDEIIDMSNGIMIARGDLGVETPFDHVPMVQKMIAKKCNEKAKPVIIATQMLESMITNFRPTRAEANDVANAVLDGADAVMLSGETSVGKFPVEAVKAMHKIINWTEKNGFHYNRETLPDVYSRTFLPDSICLNACRMANQANAKAIVIFTFSGYTALRIASHRPQAQTFIFTRNKALVRKMALIWGAHAFHSGETDDIDEAIELSITRLKGHGYLKKGDTVVHVGSTPFDEKGQTNMIKLSYVR